MNKQTLQLEKIKTDGGTQARAELSEDVVGEYAEAIKAGADLPPVVVFQDGKRYWLADGFHRFHAHRKAGAIEIDADVRVGTKRDAILHSVGANASHGLRRTNADKRCAVKTMLADKEWAAWSDRQIADTCGVSAPFVAAIRNPERAEKQQQQRAASSARAAESDSSPAPADAATPATPSSANPTAAAEPAQPTSAPATSSADPEHEVDSPEDEGHEHEHEQSEVESLRQQVTELTDILAGFDAVSAGEQEAANEISRLTSQLRVANSQRDQWMTTCNEVKRQVKALQRENERLLALVPKEAA